MKFFLEIEDELFLSLAERAKKESMTIEALIVAKLSERADQRQDLDDKEIAAKVSQMSVFAYNTFDQDSDPFTVQMLFEEQYGKGVWQLLTDSCRKKIGRRFKAAVDEVFVKPSHSKHQIQTIGKTPANAALYQICVRKTTPLVNLLTPNEVSDALKRAKMV